MLLSLEIRVDLEFLNFDFRLGFLIDFLSHAAVVGFMGGAAITIALQQLKGFLGIKKFTKKTDIVAVLESVFSSAHHGVIKESFNCSVFSFFHSLCFLNPALNHMLAVELADNTH